jgi:hypothetical protein
VGDSEHFFESLPELDRFADVAELEHYSDAPSDWLVVVTDVRGSTKAIEQGRYRDVNSLGAASIIALRNALPDIELPFVFGGDGATLLIPESRRAECETALRGLSKLAREAYELELRCGVVPVSQLLQQGQRVGVARFRVSPHTVLAMFMGDGFSAAERRIKQDPPDPITEVPPHGPNEISLEGFECRWQPIATNRGVILSLLVAARSLESRAKTATYRQVLATLEQILGSDSGHPVSLRGLKLQGPFGDFSAEARAKSGSTTGPEYDKAYAFARKKAVIGKVLTATGKTAGGFDGKAYPLELIQNCDFRKFDDVLRMVVDVSLEQAKQIEEFLTREHQHDLIAFGIHRSESALMTCLVRSFSGDHVHFIDGSNGGYALAAKQLKAQLASWGRASIGPKTNYNAQ